MKRREFLKAASASAACATLAGGAPTNRPGGRPSGRPNIIFFLTDDQRWDTLGCMGKRSVKTPNIDRLAAGGVLFDNAYVTTSICCTSRASILTGQYARRHGIHQFRDSLSDQAFAATYPPLLRKAGYRTGFIGKYGVGAEPKDAFDVWHGRRGQPKYEHTDENGKYKHLTAILGEQSIDFLRGCRPGQPFCLSVSFKAPHCQDSDPRQFLYDPAYKDLYKDVTIPTPATAAPKYWRSFPEFFRAGNEARRRWRIRFATPDKYQEMVKGYYRLITGVDVAVGRFVEALERRGLAGNTVIIFSSDNGFYLGEHGLAGKWYGHEESIRVPLLIHDPRLPAARRGHRRHEKALNIDVAPTILSLAGVPVPERMQGRSLVPLVQGRRAAWRQEFFYEHLFRHPAIHRSEGLVGQRYKYLRYIDAAPVYEELYDLKEDPHEGTNLAGRAENAKLLKRMRARCDELLAAAK